MTQKDARYDSPVMASIVCVNKVDADFFYGEALDGRLFPHARTGKSDQYHGRPSVTDVYAERPRRAGAYWEVRITYIHHVNNGAGGRAKGDFESFVGVLCGCANPKRSAAARARFRTCPRHAVVTATAPGTVENEAVPRYRRPNVLASS